MWGLSWNLYITCLHYSVCLHIEALGSSGIDGSEVAAEVPAPLCLCQRVTPVRSELCQHLGTDSGVNRIKIN